MTDCDKLIIYKSHERACVRVSIYSFKSYLFKIAEKTVIFAA